MRPASPTFFLFPAALVTLLVAAALWVPRLAAHPGAQWPLLGAAAGLCAWLAVLFTRHRSGARPLTVDRLARPQHYVQIGAHALIYTGWARAFPEVPAHLPHVATQIALLYLLDMAYSFTRTGRFTLSFGPFPIVFSTNLFLWFHDDCYGLQYAMLALGHLGKVHLRWPPRDGAPGRHVFNPSALGLAVASVALIALQRTDLTYGPQIAATMEQPPYPHLWIFGVGLLVQLVFSPVLVTMSAAVACVLGGLVVHALTDRWLFVDTAIPVNVFLGMTLLVTDPSTSPRSGGGKVLFGAAYGLSVLGLYPLLEAVGAWQNPADPLPLAYFDKLLQVPLLNLLSPALDGLGARLGARWAGPLATWPERRRNALHVVLWAGVFAALHPMLHDHPGRDPALWARLCETRGGAFCREVAVGHDLACFERDDLARCAALARMNRAGQGIARNDERAGQLFARACERGHAPACTGLAELLTTGGDGVPRREAQALVLFGRACEGGDGAGCAALAELLTEGVVVPPDHEGAAAARRRACELGQTAACGGR